jgi:hypothetical protein
VNKAISQPPSGHLQNITIDQAQDVLILGPASDPGISVGGRNDDHLEFRDGEDELFSLAGGEKNIVSMEMIGPERGLI